MTEVYLALGSNVGDSPAAIARAVELLEEVLNHVQAAPVYRSKAIGYTDQPDFFNTAVSGQTELSSTELLARIKDIEQQLGRVERFRWGPREIDIDIIFYGDQVLETRQLTIPHPAFRDRDFVLQPLIDLNSDLADPATGQKVSGLLSKLPASRQTIK
jgi:2-amino-4-hydroxy-6-hydroxymethyldihydropteridine diphosphokinase